METTEIRNAITLGAAFVGKVLTEEQMAKALAKMTGKTVKNPKHYAWTMGRNAAVTLVRREKSAANMRVRALEKERIEKEVAKEQAARAAEIAEAAKEYRDVLPTMLKEKRKNMGNATAWGYEILRCVLEQDNEGFINMYVKYNDPDAFYQCRKRALIRCKKFLSEKTIAVLESLKNCPRI